MSKKRKIIILSGLGIIILILIGGIFWIGKKSYQKEESAKSKTSQKIELEERLQQLKNQLQKETNPTKKQELETKKVNLEQQLNQLKNQNKPSSPNSNNPNSPNNNNNPPQQIPPQKTNLQWTVKYSTEVGGEYEYINTANYKERVLIDKKNKIFSSVVNLLIPVKDNQYTISFNKEDAEKKGNNFIFDENNNKFNTYNQS